jgi:hypothetical protein
VGYDISPLKRVKDFTFNSLEWRNIVTHGQLKENLYSLSCLLTIDNCKTQMIAEIHRESKPKRLLKFIESQNPKDR